VQLIWNYVYLEYFVYILNSVRYSAYIHYQY